MIADALIFLRKHLDDQLRIALGGMPDDASDERVVFVNGDQMDPIAFKLGAVSMLLINLEEERALRNPDMYLRRGEDGQAQRGQPDIRLILYVLFVARFKQYDVAWQHLSKIIEHLQSARVLEAEVTPTLPSSIQKLVLELVTLGFAEQNEVWNALRTAHHPSILYRVKMIAFRDQKTSEAPEVKSIEARVQRVL